MVAKELPTLQGLACSLPLTHKDKIVLGHGSGGRMSHNLINQVFLPRFNNPTLSNLDDASVFRADQGKNLAISTDTHVVWPLFFPGGDIGKLAVCGTVNDLAMVGAVPLYLTVGFILEEGLEFDLLERVIDSMRIAAGDAGVTIIAGDTKVVQRGKADGLYINTTGIGVIEPEINISGSNACPGDVVILSGSIGDHGIAVLSARGELGFEADICSDIAPLNKLVLAMMRKIEITDNDIDLNKPICGYRYPEIKVLRDPTRGGLASSLNEIARQSEVGIILNESTIPCKAPVNAACELLGFDPIYIANEGKLIAIVDRNDADLVLERMHASPYGEEAVIIGEVQESPMERVLMKTAIGSTRVIDMPAGEILPRIC